MGVKPELVDTAEYPGFVFRNAPRNVYWEMTIACDLDCVHCRASAIPDRDPLELTTEQGRALMRDVKELGSMIILTGGDPMKRDDLFDLIGYGREIGLKVSITPSTTPTLTHDVVRKFKELGIAAMGTSLDAPNAEAHDSFRRVEGTFANALNALAWAREFDIPVQINTTVTTRTLPYLPEMYQLLSEKFSPPVRRWSLFLLVPVGRGQDLGIPSADQVEELCEWVYETAQDAPFHVGTVEGPHYRRYWVQRNWPKACRKRRLKRWRCGWALESEMGTASFLFRIGRCLPGRIPPVPAAGQRSRRAAPLDLSQLAAPCTTPGHGTTQGEMRAL